MHDAGGELVKHYRELAFMGFTEVLMNLRTIFRNIAFCKKDIEEYKPDAVVLIDYPGFNMRIAEWAKKNGIRTYYYISPQIWAWKEKRVEKIKRDVDRMFVVLPFEKKFYQRHSRTISRNYPRLSLGQTNDPMHRRAEVRNLRQSLSLTCSRHTPQ